MKKYIVIIATAVVLAAPATAEAAYLHMAEAKLEIKKVSNKQQPRVGAHSYTITHCSRRDGHRVQCFVAFKVKGQNGNPNEVWSYRALCNRTDSGFWTRLQFDSHVEA